MEKIKVFLPIIIIILISTVLIFKNSGLISNNDSYVVSEVENKRDYNEGKNEEKNEEKINNMEKLNESLKDNDLETMQNSNDNKSTNKKLTIYISGAVKSPKVVELDSEERLMDGVMLCDGVTEDADMNKINMAMKVEDGGHYIIPKIGEESISNNNEVENMNNNENINKSLETNEDTNKININNASIIELDSLPGVGEVTAQKIIDYREENTNFKSVEEIKNVKGIGENKFNDLKDYICIQ
jgi:competence protein ComEA